MKAVEQWRPSKYLRNGDKLVPSNDPKEIGIGSQLGVSIETPVYWRMLRKHARGSLIDVGSGKVPLYEAYRDLVSEVICIDWPNSWHGTSHLDMEVDLNEGIPYPDQRFDTIVCSSVLEHLRRPDLFWKEAFRILAPGGKLILGVPFMYWIHEAPHDYHRFTEYQLQSACEECGLELIAIEVPAGALAIVLDVIGKNIPGRFRRLSKAYQRLAMRFLWSRLGQRIDERNRRHFPIGYFLVAQRPAAASRYSLGSSGT